jgi:hypothetical protein
MSRKARARPSWKKKRLLSPEVTVSFVPVPIHNPGAIGRDPALIDDQTLHDALRAPGVPDASDITSAQPN